MKKVVFRSMSFLIIFFCLLANPFAQSKRLKKTARVPLDFQVRLPISVFNKQRQFVPNLVLNDFTVLENGRRQKITSFTDEKTSLPVFVGLLVDTSTSTQSKIKYLKEPLKDLAYSLTKSRKNKTAFMTFDRVTNLRQDFTDKIDLLDRSINTAEDGGQQNSLYDAIWQFCDERLRDAPGRRSIIVVSNSSDNFSRANLKDAIDVAQRLETVIYIVSINDINLKSDNAEVSVNSNDFLDRLATETGGAVFFANDTLNLEKAFISILKEINSQYTFTYRPKNQKRDGKERKIEVRFTEQKRNREYKIRTKTKYRMLKAK